MKILKPIPFLDLVSSISNATDLIDPLLNNHSRRVAYIALNIAEELGLPTRAKHDIIYAGLMHDIGAFSLKEKRNAFKFEFEAKINTGHGYLGFLLLRKFQPFKDVAVYVKHHHSAWNKIKDDHMSKKDVLFSQILNIADRTEVLLNRDAEVLGQVEGISKRIKSKSGIMFSPDLVDVLEGLTKKEYFWLDAVSKPSISIFHQHLGSLPVDFTLEDSIDFAKMFAQIIDFRSPFTSTHSSGVTTSAEAIAREIGFPENECKMMRVAGYLHDLGKLAVPAEILNKPSGLTDSEFKVIRSHTYYTFRILENIPNLETINTWAAFHHETLDGKGYPFHIGDKDLPLGSRIMAVADIFTALTENRPYRVGLKQEKVMKILSGMVAGNKIDPNVVSALADNYDNINTLREDSQKQASVDYKKFYLEKAKK